jgi:excinuclease ABC subunit A
MTAITGVSGSGKTSLLHEILEHAQMDLGDAGEAASAGSKPLFTGSEQATLNLAADAAPPSRIISIDQKPIGRSPRSNLATYTGLFDGVRRLFAQTPEARARRYTASRFSFNVRGGRCETCQGEGYISVELLFLPENYSPCPDCQGRRYNPETLQIRYDGLNIADVLALSVADAAAFFDVVPAVKRSLDALLDVGLSYLTLGQPATELSGGEAQRIKLATELQRQVRAGTIFVLDEPTGGLHPANVRDLTAVFRRLADAGSTVLIVEHDMAVVAAADWVIELGPGGGDKGGMVVAAESPRELVRNPRSISAQYLAKRL